jgi:predicted membrane channel-forming protein YqfA (hemolysin III family)
MDPVWRNIVICASCAIISIFIAVVIPPRFADLGFLLFLLGVGLSAITLLGAAMYLYPEKGTVPSRWDGGGPFHLVGWGLPLQGAT